MRTSNGSRRAIRKLLSYLQFPLGKRATLKNHALDNHFFVDVPMRGRRCGRVWLKTSGPGTSQPLKFRGAGRWCAKEELEWYPHRLVATLAGCHRLSLVSFRWDGLWMGDKHGELAFKSMYAFLDHRWNKCLRQICC